jgi:hypothetical protein
VYANWINYIDPGDVFSVLLSVKPIVMALLGGVGTLTGPVIGAVGLVGLEELVTRSFLDLTGVVLGPGRRGAGSLPAAWGDQRPGLHGPQPERTPAMSQHLLQLARRLACPSAG